MLTLFRHNYGHYRSSRPEVFCKQGVEISWNLQESTRAIVSFLIKLQAWAWNFIKKETLAQVFSCEFCKICKKTFSIKTPLGDCFWYPVDHSENFHSENFLVLFLDIYKGRKVYFLHSSGGNNFIIIPDLESISRWLAWLIWNLFLRTNFFIIW